MYLNLQAVIATIIITASPFFGNNLSAQQVIDRSALRSAYPDFAPNNFTNQDGKLHGVMRLIAQQAGYDVEFVEVENSKRPEDQAASETVTGQMDIPDDLANLRIFWFGRNLNIAAKPWLVNVALIVGGICLSTVALGTYVMRLRRRLVRLLIENGENRLLIEAIDQISAGVAIFDTKMRAAHWNKGFENRFPKLVPLLRKSITIEQFSLQAQDQKVFFVEHEPDEMAHSATEIAAGLREGKAVHHIVKTPNDDRFDLSMFRLGTGHYAAIWVDVTQQHQQQERITSQSTELARKNDQLSAFSAMAAHDLKAPLMQQSALMDIILEEVEAEGIRLPNRVQGHFLTLIDVSRRMNTLVDDLLVYAKADQTRIASDCFSPSERLNAIVKLFGSNPNIKIDVTPDMPNVWVEPNAFDMVMRNLISNAVKHHDRSEARISLRGHKDDTKITIEVEDDGPGIAVSEREQVFEPFCRLTNVEGTGLGLSFVKKTIETWGGTISIRSTSERGSIFQITLPAISNIASETEHSQHYKSSTLQAEMGDASL